MIAVHERFEREGQIARLTLARPKANLLDAAMVTELRAAIGRLVPLPALKLVIIDAEGPHFSFGASVPEHLPSKVHAMLTGFHALFRELEALGVPTAAIVRGQCLGGAFELAIACGRVYCDPTARFAVPEITLGVFPPIAAVLLPFRVRMPEATSIVLSGAPFIGEDAAAVGVADECAADPEAACLAWFDSALAAHSAVAIRCAWRALRRPVARALANDLADAEQLYLGELMRHRDPVEGLQAFIERRPPIWEHR